jgi:hypothetical protein
LVSEYAKLHVSKTYLHIDCLEAIELSEKLIYFSQNIHYDCDDDNCLLLSGIILDSAYKIRLGVEKRRNKLEAKGKLSLITSHTKDQKKS